MPERHVFLVCSFVLCLLAILVVLFCVVTLFVAFVEVLVIGDGQKQAEVGRVGGGGWRGGGG